MVQYSDLLGVPFELNKHDCFAMFRKFYKINFDIDVPDFSRPNDWDADKLDLIGKLYRKVGMEKIEGWDLRPGDVLATAIGSSNPNHLVIYVGDNKIIQHKLNALSTEEEYRPVWKMVTCYVLRHPLVPDLRPVYPDVLIEELVTQNWLQG